MNLALTDGLIDSVTRDAGTVRPHAALGPRPDTGRLTAKELRNG